MYAVVAVGVTVMDWVVAPVDQRYDEPVEAVSVTGEPPHVEAGPVIVAVAAGYTVTTTGDEVALHEPLETVTVKLPDVVTLIDCVVAPFDHRYAVPAVAVRVTLPPAQNVVGPEAVMLALTELTVTVAGADVAGQPIAFVTVTV